MENNKKNIENKSKNQEKTQKNGKISAKKQNFHEKPSKQRKGLIVGLSVATALLAISTVGLGIGLGISHGNEMNYKNQLENVYKNNFYDLLDSVNNLENKVAKIINSSPSSTTYQRKTLLEASRNASEAEISVSYLPFSYNEIEETQKMVNQISGYTSTLAEKLATGGTLSQEDIDTLENIHYNLLQLQNQLNEFERKLGEGYSIVDESRDFDTDINGFTKTLSQMKNNDVQYPTMIYDGPFSDSVTNAVVKGLKGDHISKDTGAEVVQKNFKTTATMDYEGETKGRFETYNYRATNADDEMLYVQVTQIGGHILTVSGAGRDGEQSVDMAKAKEIALEFASQNGIKNGKVVWSDQIGGDVYLNIAPTSDGIILYPDLVKVKINLASGTVVGYDATTYFTNHVARTLSKGSLTESTAVGKVPSTFEIVQSRYVLSPLDYNREVVCVEVEATKDDGTYYFYFNVQNGDLENVLKVIKTDNGNLLM